MPHATTDGPSLDAIQSPFPRLRDLLGETPPGDAPIDLTIGEPRHALPAFLAERLAEAVADYGKYPPIAGTPALRGATAAWHSRRYGLTIDAETEVIALNGSREGLVNALLAALAIAREDHVAGAGGDTAQTTPRRDTVLMPNPFYQCYLAGTLAGAGRAHFLPTGPETGELPDLEALAAQPELLARSAVLILCSPANPQGAVADRAYLARAIALCRANGLRLFVDECYSEIYADLPPPGLLEIAAETPERFAGVLAFNSLSKRSNVPGLRSGFCAGDPAFLAQLTRFRNVSAPQVPLPIQHASAALWDDEAHVAESRALYRQKFDLADQLLQGRFGYQRPAGGFFLWLDLAHFGGGERGTVTLWQRCGVKLLPGTYLSQPDPGGRDPAFNAARLALVQDIATTEQAFQRMVAAA